MVKYIMSVTAQDRAGIVAGISAAGLELNGNIIAASQTVHQGYFSMMILWDVPDEVTCDQLNQAVSDQLGPAVHVYVMPYQQPQPKPADQNQPFIVTCIGPDRPGILRELAHYLSSRQINIDDLYACVEHDEFIVICEVSIPVGLDVFMIQADLESVGRSLGVAIQMQHEDVFIATNELSLHRRRASTTR